MTIEKRLENALRISKTIENGKLDSKNLYDLLVHTSEALEQAEKLAIHSVVQAKPENVCKHYFLPYKLKHHKDFLCTKCGIEKSNV
jgi:hypothetical protein